MTTTLIVDGNNILIRACKAAEHSMRLSVEHEEGEVNTGPLLVFINLMAKYVRQVQPDHLAVCWDGGKSTHRLALFEGYKAERGERVYEDGYEEPERPFGLAKEFLTLAGFHHIEVADVEADDLVAAYWRQRTTGERFVILSADKDFLQLLDPGVELVRPGGGDDEVWTAARLAEEYGCTGAQLGFIMALTGDKGDGVPGVGRVGHKTAVKLLSRNHWDLNRALVEEPSLQGKGEAALRNYQLVDLREDRFGIAVPPPPRFAPTSPGSLTYQALLDWLRGYELASVQDRLANRTLWS